MLTTLVAGAQIFLAQAEQLDQAAPASHNTPRLLAHQRSGTADTGRWILSAGALALLILPTAIVLTFMMLLRPKDRAARVPAMASAPPMSPDEYPCTSNGTNETGVGKNTSSALRAFPQKENHVLIVRLGNPIPSHWRNGSSGSTRAIRAQTSPPAQPAESPEGARKPRKQTSLLRSFNVDVRLVFQQILP